MHTLAQIPLMKQHCLVERTAEGGGGAVAVLGGGGAATAPEHLHGNRLESSIFRSAYCQRRRMNPVLIREAKPHHTPGG